MKNKNFIGGMLAVAVMLFIGLACSGHGTKIEYNGGELYYTDNVTEAEAKKLGDYLVKQEFFDGKPKSVQIEKSGSTYQFRMVVVPEKQNDESTLQIFKAFAKQLSTDVFNGAPTELHVCDEQLKTLKVVTP
jgi:preprotein translocase subunit SecF